MVSLRAGLEKLGISNNAPFRYSQFALRPDSLRTAIRAMETPGEFHARPVHADREIDESWTQECQGIAWVDSHWILSSNGSEWSGGSQPKALYTFPASSKFRDRDVVHRFDINDQTVPGVPGGIYHVGAITWQDKVLHVDHWNPSDGGQVLEFTVQAGIPTYRGHTPLRYPIGRTNRRVGLVAINRWTGHYITAHGDINIDRLYIHDGLGTYTRRDIMLDPPITDGGYVQGGFFSPNGHIYISSGRSGLSPRQYIYGYHALTGRRFATIEIISEGSTQELEGCCFVDLTMDGYAVQIMAILLENNIHMTLDDVYIKAIAADRPEFV